MGTRAFPNAFSYVGTLLVACVSALAATVGVASAKVPVPAHEPGAIPMPVAELAAVKMPVATQTHSGKLQVPPTPAPPNTAAPEPPTEEFHQSSKSKKGWTRCWVTTDGVKGKAFHCPVFPAASTPKVQQGFLEAVQCAAAVVTFIAGNYLVISKIKKAGGVWKFAKQIKRKNKESKQKHRERVAKAFVAMAAEVAGTATVAEKCF